MAILITGTFEPTGSFPIAKAADVEMPDGTRLDAFKGGVTSVNGQTGAVTITVDSALSATSTNPVQNKVITAYFNNAVQTLEQLQASIPTIDTTLSKAGQAADAGAVGAVLLEANTAMEQMAQAIDKVAGSIPTDTYFNSLIDAKLGVIENGSY